MLSQLHTQELHFQLNLMAFVDNCKLPTFVDVVKPQMCLKVNITTFKKVNFIIVFKTEHF